MDWLFPSLKASLFPAKSTSAIPVDPPAPNSLQPSAAAHPTEAQDVVVPHSPDYKAMVEDTDSPMHSNKPNHQLMRRRSSLSDLDSLLKKERAIRSSDLLTIGEYAPSKRADRHGRVWSMLLDGQQQQQSLDPWTKGGSIGDMINLKLYGSNRSLMSGTSSIAEAVPLETIQRKKTTSSVVSSTNSDDVFRHQRLASSAQEDTGHNDSTVDGPVSNGDYEDDPFGAGCGDGVIEEEDEIEELENDRHQDELCELRSGRRARTKRSPSIVERTERLSILIRNHERRYSRHADDIAVKVIE